MMFPWNNVFEYFRDRGRGALFFCGFSVVLGLVIGGITLGRVLGEELARKSILILFSVLGIMCLVQIALWIRRARVRRLNRYKVSPLSRDEICKARSKLMKKQSF